MMSGIWFDFFLTSEPNLIKDYSEMFKMQKYKLCY